MKNKLIIGVILIVFCFSIFLNFYRVEAYSGEIDSKNYINLPSIIYTENGIGKATISLSSGISGYAISYQKVDITQKEFSIIQNKYEEVNGYREESIKILEEKEAIVNKLQNRYQTLQNRGTGTPEELEEAYNKYKEAYDEYQKFYNTANANIKSLQNEYLELIPNYTNSWKNTTNTANNLQLDLSSYSGTIYFVLWVKITNGTNTYYDVSGYTSTVNIHESITLNMKTANIGINETIQLTASSSKDAKITWTSSDDSIVTVSSEGLVKGLKEGTAIITAKGSEKTATCTVTVGSNSSDTNGEWTDFSNAEFSLKKEGLSKAIVEISNITPKRGNSYYLVITSNSSKPNVTSEDSNEKIILEYNDDSKILKTTDSDKVARYVELNQELYASVIEVQNYGNEEIVIYGKRLEKYAEPKYSDAFYLTHMTNESDQIITTFTSSGEENRKMQIKVGKITDLSILQKIKNQDSSGFVDLLSFAKSNDGIYNKILDSDEDSSSIEYNANSYTGRPTIDLKGLQDGEYYFLYIKTDDENGKYIPQEAVTLAQASVYPDAWFLFFYGSSDFEWADIGDVTVDNGKDNTIATGTLPQTGSSVIIGIIVVTLIGVGVFSYIQYRKNNF